jgi:hypothetical protein
MEHMTLHHEILGSVVTKWCILNTDFGDGFYQPRPLYLSPEICAKGMCFDSFGHAERGAFFAGNHPDWGLLHFEICSF